MLVSILFRLVLSSIVRGSMHLPYIEVANVSLEQKQPMSEMSHPASLEADVAHVI